MNSDYYLKTFIFNLLVMFVYFVCVCVCVVNAMRVCQRVFVEVRAQISGADSLLLPCGVVRPEHKYLYPLNHLSGSLINSLCYIC